MEDPSHFDVLLNPEIFLNLLIIIQVENFGTVKEVVFGIVGVKIQIVTFLKKLNDEV